MHCLGSLVMMWDIVRYKIEREGVVTASLGGGGGGEVVTDGWKDQLEKTVGR